MHLLLWNFILSWKFFKAVLFFIFVSYYDISKSNWFKPKNKTEPQHIHDKSLISYLVSKKFTCICELEVANISESNRIDSSILLTTIITFIFVLMCTLSSIQQVWCHYLLIRNRLFDLHYFHCYLIPKIQFIYLLYMWNISI